MQSTYLTERYDLGKRLVKELLKKYEYVSLLGKHVFGKNIMVSSFAKQVGDTYEKQCGFVIKVFNEGIYSEYSFAELEESNFDKIIKNVEEQLNVSKNLLKKHMDLSLLDDEPLVQDFERKVEGKKYTTEELVGELESLKNEIVAQDKRIIQGIAIASWYTTDSFFISKNRALTQDFTWEGVYLIAVAREGNVVKEARKYFGGNNIEASLENGKKAIKDVTNLALELLKAEAIVPGEYDIITHPSITGLIAHEAFGHGVEMDMFVKHRARSRLYINKPVASKFVSMHDGASAAYSVASYFFDDDGVLAHDTKIIDKGILQTGICDVIAANELNTKATGNSRRESAYRKAYTRMTNTFFEPGDSEVEEMIKSIKHGYMLFDTNNGMEDPKNWNIQCVAEYGREIKDGKFTGKIISPVVMSGDVLDLLFSVSMVSKDFEVIGGGHCGKGHKEWVPVSDGGPYLKARCKLS